MSTTRCKFRCTQAEKQDYGIAVSLTAEYSESKEDNQFSEATPSGALNMIVSNPAVDRFFEVGKSYYLDISPA